MEPLSSYLVMEMPSWRIVVEGRKKMPDDGAIWIDVWFPSHEEARRWDRRIVEVTIVEPCEEFDRRAFHPTHPPERKRKKR